MGQYHKVYNKTKNECLNAHKFGQGLKLVEQIGFEGSVADVLFLLLANSNGRGGGDFKDHEIIGRWAGDEIVVQGDYAEEGDAAFIPDSELEQYVDISHYAKELFEKEQNDS